MKPLFSKYQEILAFFVSLAISHYILLKKGPWYVTTALFVVIAIIIFIKRPLLTFALFLIASIIPGVALPGKWQNDAIFNVSYNFIELSLIGLFAIWLLYKGFKKEIKDNGSIILGMVIFFIANLISIIVSTDITLSLSKSAFFFISSLAILLLIIGLVKTKDEFTLVVVIFAIAVLGVIGISMMELYVWERPVTSYFNKYTTNQDVIVAWDFINNRYYRAGSTLGNPNISGALSVLFLPLYLAIYWYKQQAPKHRLGIVIVALITQVFLSYSRAAWLSTVVLFLIWWKKYTSNQTFLNKFVNIISVIFVLYMVYIIVAPKQSKYIYERFNPGVVHSVDVTHRLGGYMVALNVMKTSPLLGIGFYNYRNRYRSFSLHGMENLLTPDNMFLRVLIDNGIIGLMAYILLLIMVFIKIRDRSRDTGLPIIYFIGWVTILVFSIESFSFDVMFSLPLRFIFWAIVGLLLSDGAKEYFQSLNPPEKINK